MKNEIYDFSVKTVSGEEKKLSEYKDKVLLIVNTASKCGFTPQYGDLQKLYDSYSDKEFEILAFPCNQFMNQEPGTSEEAVAFCQLNYGVTFEVFEKIDVNGEDTHPLFAFLKKSATGLFGSEKIKWNFTKFLVDKNGEVFKRYAPAINPEKMKRDIDSLLT